MAIFVDAYRSLNSKRLFWVALGISGLVVVAMVCIGMNDQGVRLLFWQIDSLWLNAKTVSPAVFYKQLFVYAGIGFWLSWLATILALVSTAGIFPDLVSNGAIDLFVSKPIGRLRLFLTEYVAGLLFVTLQVTIFSVASFLAIGLHGGGWEPGLLVAVPVVVCFFSYLFAICVLLGILTRSTVAALLLTLLFWFMIYAVGQAEQTVMMMQTMEKHGVMGFRAAFRHGPAGSGASQGQRGPLVTVSNSAPDPSQSNTAGLETTRQILHAVNTVLPKTTETIGLLQRWLIRLADLPKEPASPQQRAAQAARREFQEALYRRSPWWIVGTSLGFEFVVLAWAAGAFCRRDY
jgi:hypothetical protein